MPSQQPWQHFRNYGDPYYYQNELMGTLASPMLGTFLNAVSFGLFSSLLPVYRQNESSSYSHVGSKAKTGSRVHVP